jgi:hypothetical protein
VVAPAVGGGEERTREISGVSDGSGDSCGGVGWLCWEEVRATVTREGAKDERRVDSTDASEK